MKPIAKLQIAFDMIDPEQAGKLLTQVKEWVDIVEVGTPLIKAVGVKAVVALRKMAGDKLFCADLKTMDAGRLEAELAFQAGADMITVLGLSSDVTISAAIAEAEKRGKHVVADLIGVPDKAARAQELARLGVHYLGVHSGYDEQTQGADPLADLRRLSNLSSLPLAVAGGIGLHNIAAIAVCRPAIIIVGSKITAAADPAEAACHIYAAIGQRLGGEEANR